MNYSYENISEISNTESIDDLKLIRGIGPAIEKRLREAGILSYEQLYLKSPEELAAIFSDMTGLSAERIFKQDWTGQALDLAQKHPKILPETDYPNNGQHYAVFTVELLLDNANAVRRTRVVHAQSQKEGMWAGWNTDRLQNFFTDNLVLWIPQAHREDVAIEDPEANRMPASPVTSVNQANSYASTRLIKGQLIMVQTEQQSANIRTPLGPIPANYNFRLSLQFDLSAFNILPALPLKYSATVYSKALGRKLRQVTGNSIGTIIPKNEVTINLACNALQAGSYQLEVIVMFSPLDQDHKPGRDPVSIIKCGLLQVY